MRTLLTLVFLLASRAAFAQVARPWPRNAATNKIEFVGHLPWPDSVRAEAQRQRLVRRWYRQKLTNDTPALIKSFIKEDGTTYAGIPTFSCYRAGIMNRDEEHFTLCFKLSLTPDNTGVSYRFVDFECGYYAFDNGSSDSLENVLTLKNTLAQSIMESFHEQLLAGIKGW